jgi:hypothetical protein
MVTEPYDHKLYLQMYPQLWRWMNRCVCCGHVGYKPELPPRLRMTAAANNLRRMYPELWVDDQGSCEQCAQSLES